MILTEYSSSPYCLGQKCVLLSFPIQHSMLDVRCSMFTFFSVNLPQSITSALWLLSSDLCLWHFNEDLCPNSTIPSSSSSSHLLGAVRSNRQKGHIQLYATRFYGRANPVSSLDRPNNWNHGGSPRPVRPWGLKKLYSVVHLPQAFSPRTGANFP